MTEKWNESSRIEKTVHIIGICSVLAVLLLLLSGLWNRQTKIVRLGIPRADAYTGEWTAENGLVYTKEGIIPAEGSELVLSSRLPEDLEQEMILLFRNSYQAVGVRVGGEELYSYGKEKPLFGQMLGDINCLVRIGEEHAGEEIELHLKYPYGKDRVFLPAMTFDTAERVTAGLLWGNLRIIVFTVILLLLSGTMFLFWITLKVRGMGQRAGIFSKMAQFILLCAIWVLSDSAVPQWMTENGVAVCLLSFFSFFLIPVPLIGCIQELCSERKLSLTVLKGIFYGFVLAAGLCYITETADMIQLLPVSHALMGIAALAVIRELLREYKRNRSLYAGGVLVSFGVLFLFCVSAVMEFYFMNGGRGDVSRLFRQGIIVFIMMLVFLLAKRAGELLCDNAESQVYKRMAYLDYMTRMNNRTAFEQRMDQLDRERKEELTLVMIDLNGLKRVNDRRGHREGDEMIRRTAKAIQKVFGSEDCYRIGGDEFAVILEGSGYDQTQLRNGLREELRESGKRLDYLLSVSVGFARAESEQEVSAWELLKCADREMYEEKRQWYHQCTKGHTVREGR